MRDLPAADKVADEPPDPVEAAVHLRRNGPVVKIPASFQPHNFTAIFFSCFLLLVGCESKFQ